MRCSLASKLRSFKITRTSVVVVVGLIGSVSSVFGQPFPLTPIPPGSTPSFAVSPVSPQPSRDAPSFFPPPIPKRSIQVDASKLPSKSRAMLPAFDGDGLFVSIPPSTISVLPAQMVFSNTIRPILAASGFGDSFADLKRVYIPKHNGVPIPKTNVEGLLRLRCGELKARSNESNVQALCRSLASSMVAGDVASLLGKEVTSRTGMSFQEYANALSVVEMEYFFPQIHQLTSSERKAPDLPLVVPIEHTGLRATAWKGQTVNSVTGRVFSQYKPTNRVAITPAEVVTIAPLALAKGNVVCCSQPILPYTADLVMLPYGTVHDTVTNQDIAGMRFAYRVPVEAEFQVGAQSRRGVFYLWLDAEDKIGQVLQLVPLARAASATGEMIVRDPSTGATDLDVEFPIDDPTGTPPLVYTLRLSPQFNRLDRSSISQIDQEVGALQTAFPNPASPNFQTWLSGQGSPAGDPPNYQCVYDQTAPYPGIYFEQIDLMATLTRRSQEAQYSGLLAGFPGNNPISVTFNKSNVANIECNLNDLSSVDGGISAGFNITFNLCKRLSLYTADPKKVCPNGTDSGANPSFGTNSIHDHTIVSHELGHILTAHQYRWDGIVSPNPERPLRWCDPPHLQRSDDPTILLACPIPHLPSGSFHDFADAWAHHFEDTNCVGGWVFKDADGLDANKNCLKHSERGGLPRLSKVGPPDVIDLGSKDFFPGHLSERGGYANMQIAAAALWATREGIRSHMGPLLGPPSYFQSFVRALLSTGWLDIDDSNLDQDLYRGLLDLEVKLANEWVKSTPTGTESLLSKITAGFAKAGIFMIPPSCFDGVSTYLDFYCPAPLGENGGDAVIDIQDNDPTNDVEINGVKHPDNDHLKRSGPPPSFLVWTGPAYKIIAGVASASPPSSTVPSPCNQEYQVEVADNENFSNQKISGWMSVAPNMGKCFARWPLGLTDWTNLRGTSGETNLYYRVRTRMGTNMGVNVNERISTSPGVGLFDGLFPTVGHVPPPYAIVTGVASSGTDTKAPGAPQNLRVQ